MSDDITCRRASAPSLQDCPPADHAELAAAIVSHGGALVLRIGALLGSEAQRYMLHHRKTYGYLPPYDQVFIRA